MCVGARGGSKLGWIDFEVLDGALGALKEMMNAPGGASSVLNTDGALDSLVALLTIGEVPMLPSPSPCSRPVTHCVCSPHLPTCQLHANRQCRASSRRFSLHSIGLCCGRKKRHSAR